MNEHWEPSRVADSCYNKRIGIVLLFGIFLAGAIIVLIWRLPRQNITLKDGTVVQFLGFSMGTNAISTEMVWIKYVQKYVPFVFSRRQPVMLSGQSNDPEGMTLWFRRFDPETDKTMPIPWIIALIDDQGNDFSTVGISNPSPDEELRYSYKYYVGAKVLNWPRRQREFKARILDEKKNTLAEFSIPNPVRGPFPEWKPELFPITKTNGELVVTFRGWTNPWAGSVLPDIIPTNRQTPIFDIEWRGKHEPNWRQMNESFTDPTGNRFERIYLRGNMFYREPALMVKMEFCRDSFTGEFDASERVAITNWATSGSESLLVFHPNIVHQGFEFKTIYWIMPGIVSFTNGVPMRHEPFPEKDFTHVNKAPNYFDEQISLVYQDNIWTEKKRIFSPHLLACVKGNFQKNQREEFVIRDEKGKPFGYSGRIESPSHEKRFDYHYLEDNIPYRTKRLFLEYIVQPTFAFEFCAPPPK